MSIKEVGSALLKMIFKVIFNPFLVEVVCYFCEINEFKIRQKLPKNLKRFWPKTVFDIKEDSKDRTSIVYMRRYIPFQTNFFRIYFHRFLRSDSDVHHDHPWNFLLFQIRGFYKEHIGTPTTFIDRENKTEFLEDTIQRFPGDITFRDRNVIHWVELDKDYDNDKYNAPLTVAFSGPRLGEAGEEWGFWSEIEPPTKLGSMDISVRKWTSWTKYQNIKTKEELETLVSH